MEVQVNKSEELANFFHIVSELRAAVRDRVPRWVINEKLEMLDLIASRTTSDLVKQGCEEAILEFDRLHVRASAG